MPEIPWPEGLSFRDDGHRERYARYISRVPGADVYWVAATYALAAAPPDLSERLAKYVEWEAAQMPELEEVVPALSSAERRFAKSIRCLLRGNEIDLYDFFHNAWSPWLINAAQWLFSRVG